MAVLTQGLIPSSVLLAEPPPAWLARWGEFAEGFSLSDPELSAQARLVLLDCLGAIAAGMQEPETRALSARLARRGGTCPAIGAGLRLQPSDAAFVNGVAGTMLELDEGNSFARGHPGIHVLPALLAARPLAYVSGRQFLSAFVLGYEIGARIGAASRLRPTIHPHGTWGTVGAALAVAKLDGAAAAALASTISLAAPLSTGASLRAMLEGATVRNAYAGIAARNGLAAHDLAASGFTAESDGVRSVYGTVLAEGFAPEAMLEQLGSRWDIQRNYFKRHAACRFTHGALDVVAALLAAHGPLDPAAIARIEVRSYAMAAQLDAPAPTTMLGAKFSLPFAIATTIVHGAATVPAFRAAALADPAIRALALKVGVDEDAALSAMLPDRRPARVAIHLADGTVLRGETFTNRGDASDPYAPEEIEAKFLELAIPVWGERHAHALSHAVATLEQADSLSGFEALIAEPPLRDR